MQQILVYGDSLSWGIIPNTRRRLEFGARWPGVLEQALIARGRDVRVIEDCLNGRRTVWDDPFKAGRNGLVGLAQRMEINSPLALVILMLGTNDLQSTHQNAAFHCAQGVMALVTAIRQAPIEPGMPVPPVLLLAPPSIGTSRGELVDKWFGAEARAVGLAPAYREAAAALGCQFFDAGAVVSACHEDGVHLGAEAHRKLGEALRDPVLGLL
jgi:lysophospholipase L1-like esterase